jgi:hypothetical protein
MTSGARLSTNGSAFLRDFTQHSMDVSYLVSGQPIAHIFKDQTVQEELLRIFIYTVCSLACRMVNSRLISE